MPTTLLTGNGLLVTFEEATPTLSAPASWASPSFNQGPLRTQQVTPVLPQSVARNTGTGRFSLGSKVSGVRGTLLVSYVTGESGMQRTLCYLTDNLVTPSNRIVIGLDGMNRPYAVLTNNVGVTVAQVNPTYAGVPAGAQGQVILSWDSTAALDGTRFSLLKTMNQLVPSGDWATSPTTAWNSFVPTDIVLGFAAGADQDFNGQVIAVQVSNDTVQASGSTSFPSTRVFDRFLNDNVTGSTT